MPKPALIPFSLGAAAILGALVSTALAEDSKPLEFDPANNTKPESVYNEKTPRNREKAEAPPGEHGTMDLDGSLSSDQPMEGRAPAATAPRSAPGRE